MQPRRYLKMLHGVSWHNEGFMIRWLRLIEGRGLLGRSPVSVFPEIRKDF